MNFAILLLTNDSKATVSVLYCASSTANRRLTTTAPSRQLPQVHHVLQGGDCCLVREDC